MPETREERKWRLHGRDSKGTLHEDYYGRNLPGELEKKIFAKTLTLDNDIKEAVLYHSDEDVKAKLYLKLQETVRNAYRINRTRKNASYLARKLDESVEGKSLMGAAGRAASAVFYHIPHSIYYAARARVGDAGEELGRSLLKIITGGESYWRREEIESTAKIAADNFRKYLEQIKKKEGKLLSMPQRKEEESERRAA